MRAKAFPLTGGRFFLYLRKPDISEKNTLISENLSATLELKTGRAGAGVPCPCAAERKQRECVSYGPGEQRRISSEMALELGGLRRICGGRVVFYRYIQPPDRKSVV